jgi:hypothetical protein
MTTQGPPTRRGIEQEEAEEAENGRQMNPPLGRNELGRLGDGHGFWTSSPNLSRKNGIFISCSAEFRRFFLPQKSAAARPVDYTVNLSGETVFRLNVEW